MDAVERNGPEADVTQEPTTDGAESVFARLEAETELLEWARRKKLPVASIARTAIARAVADSLTDSEKSELAAKFRRDNAKALEQRKKRLEEHGMPLAKYAVVKIPGFNV